MVTCYGSSAETSIFPLLLVHLKARFVVSAFYFLEKKLLLGLCVWTASWKQFEPHLVTGFWIFFFFFAKSSTCIPINSKWTLSLFYHNEKQNMKIIKRASWQHKAELQQRAGFKLWQFIHYENERNTHISYSCCNHKIFSSYFYLDLDSLQLLSKTSSQFRFKATLKVHTFTLSWMWAAIPSIQRRKFGCGWVLNLSVRLFLSSSFLLLGVRPLPWVCAMLFNPVD